MKHITNLICFLFIYLFGFGLTFKSFPYIVRINKFEVTQQGVEWSYFNGVILDKFFILTCASLLSKSSYMSGDMSVSVGRSPYKIEKIIIHESYLVAENTVQNDIALIKVSKPIIFGVDGGRSVEISEQIDFDGAEVDIFDHFLTYKATLFKCEFNHTIDDRLGCVSIDKKHYIDTDKKRGKVIMLNDKVVGHTITDISISDTIIIPFVIYASYLQWACENANINANYCMLHSYSYKEDIKTIQNSLNNRLNDLERQQQKFNMDVNACESKLLHNLKDAKEHYDDLLSKGNERIKMLESEGRSIRDKATAFSLQINEITTYGKDKITSLEKFMYDLRNSVTKLTSESNINGNKMTDLETQLKSLVNQMNTVSVKLQQYEEKLKSYEIKINKLQHDIDRLTQQVEANNSIYSQVTTIQETAINITNTITTVVKQMDSLENSVKSKFEYIDVEKTTLNAKIEKIEDQFSNCTCGDADVEPN